MSRSSPRALREHDTCEAEGEDPDLQFGERLVEDEQLAHNADSPIKANVSVLKTRTE